MNNRMTNRKSAGDRVLTASLIVPAVLFPAQVYAAQVGCFVTAIFLGIMFLVGLGLTAVVKHFIAKYVWKVAKTPWLRLFGITWLELLLGILIFALVRTSFWFTVLIYLPFASLVNGALLARFRQGTGDAVPFVRRYAIFLLLPFALPLSLQLAGALWSAVTTLITFTDLRM